MSVRKSIAWSIAGQLISLATLLAGIVLLSRILIPREMGAFVTGQAIGAIITTIGSIGLGAYIIRAAEADRVMRGSVLAIGLAFGLVLALLLILASAPIASLMGESKMIAPLRAIALLPIISAFEIVPLAVAQRAMRFAGLALVVTARSLAVTVVAISTAMAGETYMCVAYSMIAGAIVSVLGTHIVAPGGITVFPRIGSLRPIIRFGVDTFMATGTGAIAARLAELLIGALVGLSELGIYSRASTVYTTLYSSVFGSVSRVLLVRLSEAMRTGESLKGTYAAAFDALLAVFWPALLGIAVLAGPIVHILFGPQWAGAVIPMAVLMTAQALALLFSLSFELAMLRGEVAQQARLEFLRSVGGLGFVAFGCWWGISGAATGKLAEIVLAAIIYVPQVIRLADLGRHDYLAIVSRNVLPTVAAIGPALLYMSATRFDAEVPIPTLVAIVAGGAAAWALTLSVQGHPLAEEIKRLIALRTDRRREAE